MTTGWTSLKKAVAPAISGLPTGWTPQPPVPDDPDLTDPEGWAQDHTTAPPTPAILRGPAGPTGPAGAPGGRLYKKARRALSGTRVVRIVDAGEHVDLADPRSLDDVDLVCGVTFTAASTVNADVQIIQIGEMEDAAWSFIPFRRVFLGLEGRLVQTLDPTWAFVCVVGVAMTPTKLLIDVRPAVILNP